MISLKFTAFLLLALFLSACSQQPVKTADTQQQSTEAIPSHWNIVAKLGVRNNEDSGSVTLRWQQQIEEYTIRISGPLGQGNGLLTGNNQGITITQANKAPVYSDDPRGLIAHSFGWDFPLEHLNYWVRGLSSPLLASGERTLTPSGTLATLNQSDWSLEYSRYKPVGDWLMPHRIRARHNDLVLTLIIRQWTFPQQLPTAQ